MPFHEEVRTIRRSEFSSTVPPSDFRGVTYTPSRSKGYTAWWRGKIVSIAATEGDARADLARAAKDTSGRRAA